LPAHLTNDVCAVRTRHRRHEFLQLVVWCWLCCYQHGPCGQCLVYANCLQ